MADQHIFIRSDAPSGGTGTDVDPYNSYGDIDYTAIQAIVDAGDTPIIYSTGLFEETLAIDASGTVDNKIQFKKLNEWQISNTTGKGIITYVTTHQSNILIDGPTISNCLSRGIYLPGTNTDVRNVTIQNAVIDGIITDGTGAGIDNRGSGVVVKNTTIKNIPDDGLYSDGAYLEVYGCNITRVSTTGRGDCIQAAGDNVHIHNNYLNSSDAVCLNPKQAIWVNGDNARVYRNWCKTQNTGIVANDTHSNVTYFKGDGHLIYGNILQNGVYGIFGSSLSNSIIANNFVTDCLKYGITGPAGGNYIVCNTVMNASGSDNGAGHGIRLNIDSTLDAHVYNNILANNQNGMTYYGTGTGTLNHDYNIFYNNDANGIALGNNSISGTDPLLLSSGKLQIGSFAIDMASWIAGVTDQGLCDPWGFRVDGLPNVGCDQRTGRKKDANSSFVIGSISPATLIIV